MSESRKRVWRYGALFVMLILFVFAGFSPLRATAQGDSDFPESAQVTNDQPATYVALDRPYTATDSALTYLNHWLLDGRQKLVETQQPIKLRWPTTGGAMTGMAQVGDKLVTSEGLVVKISENSGKISEDLPGFAKELPVYLGGGLSKTGISALFGANPTRNGPPTYVTVPTQAASARMWIAGASGPSPILVTLADGQPIYNGHISVDENDDGLWARYVQLPKHPVAVTPIFQQPGVYRIVYAFEWQNETEHTTREITVFYVVGSALDAGLTQFLDSPTYREQATLPDTGSWQDFDPTQSPDDEQGRFDPLSDNPSQPTEPDPSEPTDPKEPVNPPVDPERPGESGGSGTGEPTDPKEPVNPPVEPERPGEDGGFKPAPQDPQPVKPGSSEKTQGFKPAERPAPQIPQLPAAERNQVLPLIATPAPSAPGVPAAAPTRPATQQPVQQPQSAPKSDANAHANSSSGFSDSGTNPAPVAVSAAKSSAAWARSSSKAILSVGAGVAVVAFGAWLIYLIKGLIRP